MSSQQSLLSNCEKLPLDLDDAPSIRRIRNERLRCLTPAIVVALVVSVTLNVLQALKSGLPPSVRQGETVYSGLPFNTPKIYRDRTEYWGHDTELADRRWDEIDTDSRAVALHDEYVQEKGLPPADRFPWDDEKGIYYIKAFHDLHCLKLIRRFAQDLYFGRDTVIDYHHFGHCLDGLRQDIMCKADDTPMQGNAGLGGIGNAQTMKCRSWEQLVAWTQEPERHACHRLLNDYKPENHTLERFAFCPEWSPYRDIQRQYFEKWGHRLPTEDERHPISV